MKSAAQYAEDHGKKENGGKTKPAKKVTDITKAKHTPSTDTAFKVIMMRADDPRLVVDPTENGRFAPYRDTDPDVINFANVIANEGVKQNLLARPIGNNKFKLTFGFRRHKAAEINLARGTVVMLPVRIQELNDYDAFISNLSENDSRRDRTIMDVAHTIQRFTNVFGKNDKQIAEHFGLSPAWVSETVKLLRLPEKMKQEFHDKKVSRDTAIYVAKLDEAKREMVWDEATEEVVKEATHEISNILPIKQADEIIAAATGGDAKLPAEHVAKRVEETAVKRGVPKDKAKKLGAAAAKKKAPVPQTKHVTKAAESRGAAPDKRPRKLGDIKDKLAEYTSPVAEDEILKEISNCFLDWIEGKVSTKVLDKKLNEILNP